MAGKPAAAPNHQPASAALGRRRILPGSWHERIRDPCLTALLVLELCAIFLAAPLAAKGLPIARAVADTLVLAVLAIVVLLSQKWGAIFLILLGMAVSAASFSPSGVWSPMWTAVFRRGGNILVFSALTWVVAHAVYAPGRITFHRLQGAIVIYLSLATIFAAAYSFIWELSPGAFANIVARMDGPEEIGTMLYFSLATLTTTGYGDIVPLDPFARSLANLESVVGPFYLAITVARLVTLELEDRRR
jgi:voltage-gated potassium channel Kch